MTPAIHPACAAWPRPSDAAVQEMAASIKAEGLHNPIWLTRDGEVLDGKTRLEACEIAGVEPRFQTYEGDDYARFTIAQNAHRRHLEVGARSLIIAALAKLSHGGDRRSEDFKVVATTLKNEDQTMDELAEASGINRITLVRAKTLLEKGEPNVIDMVRNGEVGVVNAALFAKNTLPSRQREVDAKTVQKEGAALRRPNKKPGAEVHQLRPTQEKAVSIHVLIDDLVPLFERVKVQSTKHVALISKVELGFIAAEGQRLIDRWASDDDSVRRMRGHVVPLRHPATRKG